MAMCEEEWCNWMSEWDGNMKRKITIINVENIMKILHDFSCNFMMKFMWMRHISLKNAISYLFAFSSMHTHCWVELKMMHLKMSYISWNVIIIISNNNFACLLSVISYFIHLALLKADVEMMSWKQIFLISSQYCSVRILSYSSSCKRER
jgi:hypothetical protein